MGDDWQGHTSEWIVLVGLLPNLPSLTAEARSPAPPCSASEV